VQERAVEGVDGHVERVDLLEHPQRVTSDGTDVATRDDPLLELGEALHCGARVREVEGEWLDRLDAAVGERLDDRRERRCGGRSGREAQRVAAAAHEGQARRILARLDLLDGRRRRGWLWLVLLAAEE
jgi:hypothetical protein